jgi:hypothetical protein
MPKENPKNLLPGPDNEQGAVEAHEATKNRFADQESQVGMTGPCTAETVRRHSQTRPRGEPPRQTGQRETEQHGEERCLKGPNELKRPGRD